MISSLLFLKSQILFANQDKKLAEVAMEYSFIHFHINFKRESEGGSDVSWFGQSEV